MTLIIPPRILSPLLRLLLLLLLILTPLPRGAFDQVGSGLEEEELESVLSGKVATSPSFSLRALLPA